MRLFIYGTLKRTFCRHHYLVSENYLGEAWTTPVYRMFDVGTYPGLIEVPFDGLAILGEIWEVSEEALTRLDEVEGADEGLYQRRAIQLQTNEYGTVEAYFYLGEIDECPDCGDRWE